MSLKRLFRPLAVPFIKITGSSLTPDTTTVTVLNKDLSGNILQCSGTTVPVDAESGFSKGCTFIKTDAAAGIESNYINVGTTASCNFDLIGSLSDSSIIKTELVTIATADVLTLNGTPVELVVAPGTGKAIIVDRIITSIDYDSVAYATNTTLEFRYGTATTKISADMTAMIDASADKVETVGGIEAELVSAINDNIEVNVATANPTAGDSDLKITVVYRIITL